MHRFHRENDGTSTSSSCEAGGREAEGSVSLSSDITFADLAAFMLPTYFQGCIDLCASTINRQHHHIDVSDARGGCHTAQNHPEDAGLN